MSPEKMFALVFSEILKENGMSSEEFAKLYKADAGEVERVLNAELPFEAVRQWFNGITGYKEDSRLS